MYMENGEETIIRFVKEGQPYEVAVDDESYARMLNDGYEVVEQISKITRLDPRIYDPGYPQSLREKQ